MSTPATTQKTVPGGNIVLDFIKQPIVVALILIAAMLPVALAWLWYGGIGAALRLVLVLLLAGLWHLIFMLARAQPPSFAGALTALAVAMLRHQQAVSVSPEAMAAGIRAAHWPARLQRLAPGPLTGAREVWLDGGHNPSAGAPLAQHFAGQRLHVVIGMIEGKDPMSLVAPLAPSIASLAAVPVPDHDYHPPEAFGEIARAAPDVPAALAALPDDGLPVLIAGSLYLAGEVLRLNGEWPD